MYHFCKPVHRSHPFFRSVVVAVFALMGIVVGGLLTLLALFTYKSS